MYLPNKYLRNILYLIYFVKLMSSIFYKLINLQCMVKN